MKFNVAYCFCELNTKKIRETIEVDIPAVTSKEAPIAFTHKDCWFPKTRVFRWFNGSLYSRETKRSAKETGPGDPFLYTLDAVTTVKDPMIAGLIAIGMAAKEAKA